MVRPYVMTGGDAAIGLVSKVRRHAELTRGISGLRIRESLLLMSWSLRTTYGRIIPLEAA